MTTNKTLGEFADDYTAQTELSKIETAGEIPVNLPTYEVEKTRKDGTKYIITEKGISPNIILGDSPAIITNRKK
jgi:hypothetical protein